MSAPLLELAHVTTGYAGVPVVRDVSLQVGEGEVVTLLGANGAGKTTLLHTIAGLISPIEGAMSYAGAPLRGPLHQRARQGIALVTEERAVLRKLTVAENLRLGTPAPERALDLFPQLRKLANRKAGLLSGGEQQMLVLGRVLACNAKLLLVDELSFGLAPLVVRHLLATLRRAADDGAGVLLVEQHPPLALSIADRGLVLAQGRTVLSGSAAQLLGQLDDIEKAYLAVVPAGPDGGD